MIICTRKESMLVPCLSKKFHDVMKRIFEYDINNLELGDHIVIEDKLILKIMERVVVSPAEKQYEIHYDYYDIHISINGQETLGFATTPVTYNFLTPFDDTKDIGFVSVKGAETNVEITNNDVAIVFPNEPHKPACTMGESFTLRKAVAKYITLDAQATEGFKRTPLAPRSTRVGRKGKIVR